MLLGYGAKVGLGNMRVKAENRMVTNQCSPDCPQGIDIPKEMQRIDHFVERLKQDNL